MLFGPSALPLSNIGSSTGGHQGLGLLRPMSGMVVPHDKGQFPDSFFQVEGTALGFSRRSKCSIELLEFRTSQCANRSRRLFNHFAAHPAMLYLISIGKAALSAPRSSSSS